MGRGKNQVGDGPVPEALQVPTSLVTGKPFLRVGECVVYKLHVDNVGPVYDLCPYIPLLSYSVIGTGTSR